MSGMMLAFSGGSYGAAPVNTVAPVVSGTATFGQTLTTTNGTWTGAPAPTFTYQWQRVTTNISGATSSTYVLVAADVGNTIRCVVKATNTIAPAGVTANSNSTASVAATVPGAPTIGTATQTGATTATVTYTAPASNGGATITSYTATSSPSSITGTLSTAGSGTITISGLSTGTAYTFTVTATNSVGTSSASAASNSVTPAAVTGQQAYTSTGVYTWIAPACVTRVSVIVVSAGTAGGDAQTVLCCGDYFGQGGDGGYGGALVYGNNITVTPGGSYPVGVGYTSVPQSYWNCASCLRASFNSTAGTLKTAGFNGGGGQLGGCYGPASLSVVRNNIPGGGAGGTAGYSSNGRDGGSALGGAGGGSGPGNYGVSTSVGVRGGGGSGGIGLLGAGASGASACGFTPATGGSGGASAATTVLSIGGLGGLNGGGGGGGSRTGTGGNGRDGAVRIIWPGNTRSFPSTNTGDM